VGWGCKPAKKPYFASAGDFVACTGEKEDSRGYFVAPNRHQVSRVHEALRPKKGADHRLVSTMSEKG